MVGGHSWDPKVENTQAFQVWLEERLVDVFLRFADELGLPLHGLDSAATAAIHPYGELLNEILGDLQSGRVMSEDELLERAVDLEDVDWPLPQIQRFLTLARHHRLPTRLLDWSLSPRIASYFAAASHVATDPLDLKEAKIAVWALQSTLLAQFIPGHPHLPIPHGVKVPLHGNRNQLAQWGTFTSLIVRPESLCLPVDRRSVDEAVAHMLEGVPEDWPVRKSPVMYLFRVPASEARAILYRLRREGIQKHRLFPDYESIADAMLEEGHSFGPY